MYSWLNPLLGKRRNVETLGGHFDVKDYVVDLPALRRADLRSLSVWGHLGQGQLLSGSSMLLCSTFNVMFSITDLDP